MSSRAHTTEIQGVHRPPLAASIQWHTCTWTLPSVGAYSSMSAAHLMASPRSSDPVSISHGPECDSSGQTQTSHSARKCHCEDAVWQQHFSCCGGVIKKWPFKRRSAATSVCVSRKSRGQSWRMPGCHAYSCSDGLLQETRSFRPQPARTPQGPSAFINVIKS